MTRAEAIHLAHYENSCRQMQDEHSRLFSSSTRQSPLILARWHDIWTIVFNRRKALPLSAADLLKTGQLLARIAESYTEYDIAEHVLRCLDILARESDPDGLELGEILVGAGELDRRLGQLERATERCSRALEIAKRQDTAPAHKLAARILYELAYIDLYGGDAASALQKLADSHTEAKAAGDEVGAGIARALSATIGLEEGTLRDPVATLRTEAANFAALAESADVKRAGRQMFAQRWRVNCDIHAMHALLATNELEEARRAYDYYAGSDPNPSSQGNASLALTGACIALAQGDLHEAATLAARAREATPLPFESQEAAAAITALYGVISLARGDTDLAQDAFNEANALNSALRNAKGQAWAAFGLAIFASDSGDHTKAVEVLNVGIARCARCCAPLRRALTEFRMEIEAGLPHAERDWKAHLRALTRNSIDVQSCVRQRVST